MRQGFSLGWGTRHATDRSIAIALAVASASQPQRQRRAWLVLAVALAAFVVPIALEACGVLAQTTTISDGQLVISSQLIPLDGAKAYAFLIGSNVLLISSAFLFVSRIAAHRRAARRELAIQTCRLRQLLPKRS